MMVRVLQYGSSHLFDESSCVNIVSSFTVAGTCATHSVRSSCAIASFSSSMELGITSFRYCVSPMRFSVTTSTSSGSSSTRFTALLLGIPASFYTRELWSSSGRQAVFVFSTDLMNIATGPVQQILSSSTEAIPSNLFPKSVVGFVFQISVSLPPPPVLRLIISAPVLLKGRFFFVFQHCQFFFCVSFPAINPILCVCTSFLHQFMFFDGI